MSSIKESSNAKCSFCEKLGNDLKRMIEAPNNEFGNIYICEECVITCVNILGYSIDTHREILKTEIVKTNTHKTQVFISYRRDDSADITDRISISLTEVRAKG